MGDPLMGRLLITVAVLGPAAILIAVGAVCVLAEIAAEAGDL